MLVKAIETFKKLSGEVVKVGDVLDLPPEKASGLIERGRVRPLSPSPAPPPCSETGSKQATIPPAPQTGLKTQDPGHSDIVSWDSPVFGRLTAPLMELREHTFVLRHPLTGEEVRLPNEWLVSLEERSAILEYDGGMPREEADSEARRQFFGLFRKGRTP